MLAPQKRARVQTYFRPPFFLFFPPTFSLILSSPVLDGPKSFLTLIFLLLYFFSLGQPVILFNARPPFARAVFNFSVRLWPQVYLELVRHRGEHINERSIMNERKLRLDVVNQKRLSLGFAASKSSPIYISRDRNMRDSRIEIIIGMLRARIKLTS